MKKLLIFKMGFLLMFGLLMITKANAQEQGFSMNLTPTPETCENNGKITVDIVDTQNGANFSIGLYDEGTLELVVVALEATGTTLTHTFNSLGHGTYTVKVKETIGTTATEQEGTVTINNEVQELEFTVDIEENCNGLKLTTNVTAGNAVEYRLTKSSDNTIVIPWQTSNVLNFDMPFTDGQYKLEVKDNCGQIRVVELTLIQPEQPDYRVDRKNAQYLFKILKDCDHFYHVEKLYFKPWTHAFPSYRYPFQVKIEVEDPDNLGSYNTIKEETWTHSYAHRYYDIPFYRDKTYHYKITFTDACGKKFVQEDLIEPTNPSFGIEKGTADCLKNNMTLGAFRYLASPYTVTFVNAPAGFDASEFNSNFTSGSNTGTVNVPFSTYSSIEFKSDTKSMPSGNYKIQITDACGSTAEKEITIEDNHFIAYLYQNKYGCGDDKAAVQMHIATNKSYHRADKVVSVTIKSAPAEFASLYGATPYDASSNISSGGSSNGIFYMNSLPTGNYTVELIGECGVPVTRSFTLIERIFEPTVEINQKCSSFDVKVIAHSNLFKEQFYLQKYNEEQGQWADPETGALYTEGDPLDDDNAQKIGKKETSGPGSNSGALNTFERELLNLEDHGKYRVLYTYETHGNGEHTEVCQGGVINEFEISDPVISINNYSVLKCTQGSTTTSTLLLDASGVKPFKYKIIAKDGVPTDEYPETGTPSFESLDAAVYSIRITDDCGNTKVVEFSTENKRIPKIIPDNLCENENGKLFLSGVGFLTVKWFKDGVDTGVTGYEYNFMPFNAAIHKGEYTAKLYYPEDNELCSDDKVSIDLTTITNTVEAGTGKTADICIEEVSVVNLFDYIEGNYNNWGTWSDINTPATGALHNELLDIDQLLLTNGLGTYQFKYTVDGYCTGSDETTVTLNIKICLKAYNDINQTPQGVAVSGNVLTNDDGENLKVTKVTINGVDYPITSGTTGKIDIDNVGTITINEDGSYTFEPLPTFTGNVPNITYTAENSVSETDTASLSIKVIPNLGNDNNPPIAQNDICIIEQGQTATMWILANDSDPDGDELKVINTVTLLDGYTAVVGGTTVTVGTPTQILDANGKVVGGLAVSPNGQTVFTPASDFTGKVPFEYTIADNGTIGGEGHIDTAVATIIVLPTNGTNDVYAEDDANTGKQGETLTGNVTKNDFDPENNPFSVTKIDTNGDGTPDAAPGTDMPITKNGKELGKLTIADNGIYTWKPAADFVGTVVIPYEITDQPNDGSITPAKDVATLYLTALPTNCGFLRSNKNVTRQLNK